MVFDSPEDVAGRKSGELMSRMMALLDEMQEFENSERASLLLAGTSVLMRDMAQLNPTRAREMLKTVRDLSDEYLNRLG